MYLQREHEISSILAITGVTMSIEKAHRVTRHHNEEQTHKIALELGWSAKKGKMITCKACSVGKAKQLAINKHINNSKKVQELVKEYFQIWQQLRHHKTVVLPSLIKTGTL